MTTNLFVIDNVKQLRTGSSFRILLRFFRTSWGVGVLNSAVFNSFTIGLSLARFWRAFGIWGCLNLSNPPRYATAAALPRSLTVATFDQENRPSLFQQRQQ